MGSSSVGRAAGPAAVVSVNPVAGWRLLRGVAVNFGIASLQRCGWTVRAARAKLAR
ncbi:hypothetical protein G6O69_24480 [Pseudenhygromyxa sp. WMMC2535]|uniref:hypothetical protein n=1 Tax=Pseudenhygromyxa sp. WMMC2535 TaxID=2712867 RepID=UPI0015951429|nr:hypothetical protein [Pseudenhygromyxa sp. WMMC2535]NVB41020.1 hypothetical protein [Pseudenhygromyxa sp. WMMC2535]